jgi:hypothetical protein
LAAKLMFLEGGQHDHMTRHDTTRHDTTRPDMTR